MAHHVLWQPIKGEDCAIVLHQSGQGVLPARGDVRDRALFAAGPKGAGEPDGPRDLDHFPGLPGLQAVGRAGWLMGAWTIFPILTTCEAGTLVTNVEDPKVVGSAIVKTRPAGTSGGSGRCLPDKFQNR